MENVATANNYHLLWLIFVHVFFLSNLNNDFPQMDHYASYSGVQYSPLDMAEYVFWTGDENKVTSAIEEFLQEGLVSRNTQILWG